MLLITLISFAGNVESMKFNDKEWSKFNWVKSSFLY